MSVSIQKSCILESLSADFYNVTIIFIALWLYYCYYKFQHCQSPAVETVVFAPKICIVN